MPVISKMEKIKKGMFKKTALYESKAPKDSKAYRAEDVATSYVTHAATGYTFNTDEDSMNRLDRVIAVAGWLFDKAVAQGSSVQDAYDAVYKNRVIPWKTFDNQVVNCSIETLCEVQEEALNKLNEIWFKWE